MAFIGIDCAPTTARPSAYIAYVSNGHISSDVEPDSMLFGAWTWTLDIDDDQWRDYLAPLVRERSEQLYKLGHIRGAKWSASGETDTPA